MAGPSSLRREAELALAGTALIVAAVLVGLGVAGALPGFPAIPRGRAGASSAGADLLSFSSARALAEGAANLTPSTGYVPVAAIGYALAVAGTFGPPAAPLVLNASTSSCSWTAPDGTAPGPVDLPAVTTSAQGLGRAPVWAFAFEHGSAAEIVLVASGQATVYAVSTVGAPCGPYGGAFLPLSAEVIDSTAAAEVAMSWGGAALLANNTLGTSSIYSISTPYLVPLAIGTPSPPSANGTAPPPVNTTPVRYGTPGPSWTIAMTGCSAGTSTTVGSFFAMVNASSGKLEMSSGFESPEPGSCPISSASYTWPFWFVPFPVGVSVPPPSPVPPPVVIAVVRT